MLVNDVDITWRLKERFEGQLKKENLDKIFYDIEMPLVEVLGSMERHGIKLDTEMLANLSAQAEKTIHQLEKEIFKLAGEEFNIGSPKQMQEILYVKLKREKPVKKFGRVFWSC